MDVMKIESKNVHNGRIVSTFSGVSEITFISSLSVCFPGDL